jgi:iron complex transport system substrate-binding protein
MSMVESLRIVSLIPSATEMVASLGLGESLVGRSHECDYPPGVTQLPVCTAPNLDPRGSSREIHDRVEELLQSALGIYRLDLDQLVQLQPTHIVTQAQCEVCAVSLADVETAIASLTNCTAQVISLQPHTLSEVWTDLERLGEVLGVDSTAPLKSLKERVEHCRTKNWSDRPRVACIEWTDPLMAAGNWVPELVELAGGENLFGTTGAHSPWMQWSELYDADPDVMILMPCGFDLPQTQQAAAELAQKYSEQWSALRAVQTQRVYLTDGNQFFNRPGPRLVDSLEILAEILHPDEIHYGYQSKGWVPFRMETIAS